jgi:hypothetical protein
MTLSQADIVVGPIQEPLEPLSLEKKELKEVVTAVDGDDDDASLSPNGVGTAGLSNSLLS